jgi:hypothetical protein
MILRVGSKERPQAVSVRLTTGRLAGRLGGRAIDWVAHSSFHRATLCMFSSCGAALGRLQEGKTVTRCGIDVRVAFI